MSGLTVAAAAPPLTRDAPAYAPALRLLHWLMALVIFAALGLGIVAINMVPHTPERVALLAVHKSFGVTALALVCLRVILRLALGAPPYRVALSAWVSRAAHLGHFALYALMFVLPISGYLHSSAAGSGFKWFGLFPVPLLVGRDHLLDVKAGGAHYVFAWTIGVVLVAHLGAVVWHRFVKKDGVLERMWPTRS
jgi:cytochrome b561